MTATGLRVAAVTSVGDAGDHDPAEVLRYAAAVAAWSEDPVARAIVAAGRADGAAADGDAAEPAHPLEVSGFVAHPGGGAEGLVRRAHAGLAPGGMLNTRRVLVGRPDWLAEQGVTVPPEVSTVAVGQAETVAVAWHGAVRGVLTLRTAPPGPA